MIVLYSGTPGSGKSYHAAAVIHRELRHRGGIITNFPINTKKIKKVRADHLYLANDQLTPRTLISYAKEHHKPNRENQSLIVIDEAQLLFNSRLGFGGKRESDQRMEWLQFFSQHRKLGYQIILIAQSDRMLDKQIRSLIENDVRHRKLNNYGVLGFFASLLTFGRSIFYAIDVWHGTREKIGGQWIVYKKRVANIYNTFDLFDFQT